MDELLGNYNYQNSLREWIGKYWKIRIKIPKMSSLKILALCSLFGSAKVKLFLIINFLKAQRNKILGKINTSPCYYEAT